MSAYSEAVALKESLPPKGPVAWEIGKVYNALLEAAKRQEPNSTSLNVLEPLTKASGDFVANIGADSLHTVVAIVVAALKPRPQAA